MYSSNVERFNAVGQVKIAKEVLDKRLPTALAVWIELKAIFGAPMLQSDGVKSADLLKYYQNQIAG